MVFDDRTFKSVDSIYNGKLVQSLQMAIDEHITEIQLSFGGYYGVASLRILSSTGQLLSVGGLTSPHFTYRAPVGWKIVGFHGSANRQVGNDYSMPALGAICAPR